MIKLESLKPITQAGIIQKNLGGLSTMILKQIRN